MRARALQPSSIQHLVLLAAAAAAAFLAGTIAALSHAGVSHSLSANWNSNDHHLADRYANHQVLRVFTDVTRGPVADFIQANNIDLWSDLAPLTRHADLRVSPAQFKQLQSILAPGTEVTVLVENVGQLVANSFAPSPEGTLHAMDAGTSPAPTSAQTIDPILSKYKFDTTFLRYPQVMELIDDIVAAYPSLVSKSVVGKSHEGRDIVAVRVSSNVTTQGQKSSVIVLGGVHAREWASVASMVNSIHNLATHASSSARMTTLLNSFEIHYIPVTNPDGYEFTFSGDRLWRKNRQPLSESAAFNATKCVGIDINRAFPVGWQPAPRSELALGPNGSGPCGLTYPGSQPGEALEVKAIMDWAENVLVKERKANVTAFYDVHAYSQLWMYPPGYTCAELPRNPTSLANVSKHAAAAIRQISGVQFTTGQICPVLYAASGCSSDWAYQALKVPYSFAIELSPSMDDHTGFLLPAERIKVTAAEMQAGFLASLEAMAGIPPPKEGEEVVPGWAVGLKDANKGNGNAHPADKKSAARTRGGVEYLLLVVLSVLASVLAVL